MPRPLALTGITAHTQKHFTSSDKTQKEKKGIYIYIYIFIYCHNNLGFCLHATVAYN